MLTIKQTYHMKIEKNELGIRQKDKAGKDDNNNKKLLLSSLKG